MKSPLLSRAALTLLVCILPLPALPSAVAADADALDKVLSDWTKRRNALRSMRWVLAGKVLFPKGALTDHPSAPPELQHKTIPPEDHAFESRTTWLFDYEKGRIRKEIVEDVFDPRKGTFSLMRNIFLFDEATKKTRHYVARAGATLAEDRTPKIQTSTNANKIDCSLTDYPVFLGQHNVFPFIRIITGLGSLPVEVRPPIQPELFANQGNRTIQNRSCLVVRLFGRLSDSECDELWIDTASDNRVVRADSYVTHPQLFGRTEIEYAAGKRFPVDWTTTVYTPSRSILRSDLVRVEEASADVAIDSGAFEPTFPPGTEPLPPDATIQTEPAEERRVDPTRQWFLRWLPGLVLGVLVLSVAGWLRWRRARPA